ncbi:hypothetical protein ACFY2H_29830 [Streptomyces griseofuscus]|uniref:Uncharacterized protein n=1 Tax=Streptomyces griseofuscus TaxID=146922 RepID=A0A426S488_9ACTN|nr:MULTISPECIES: hypothetical protein [Streptomyces]BBC92523.1 hypothetical protein SRO_1347 [Streptomyces rochei]MBJ7004463.1 hypothetical protein [Streptomyces sp. CRPSP2-6A1]MYQ91548.1 hypothetical protein [Streptomyces sp. SID4946]QNT91644.1 hypothetical protein HEP81_01313 [Streptomyces griseofuscus]RRQ76208.1 hypothetical protein CQW39_23100 [Streptomyces griseofuscus]
MYAVVVVVKGAAGPGETPLAPASLNDAFWAHALEEDGLEHVRTVGCADGFSSVLFMRGQNEAVAAERALALSWRLVMVVPSLAGWHVDSCVVRLTS